MALSYAVSTSKGPFGDSGGRPVDLYTLTNAGGLTMKVATYGAIVTSLTAPDRHGTLADIVLGFDSLDGYLGQSPYFGATCGRVANRIRNGLFELEGKAHHLQINNPPNHLHGGVKGWDKVVWTAEPFDSVDGPSLRLTYLSPDGDEGYPGAVRATTVYTLTNRNELRVEMSAETDQTTIVNMVNHSYWNLGGVARDNHTSILEHLLTLNGDRYTPGDPVVPTGAEDDVADTAFDFRAAKPVGRDLHRAGGDPVVGYDHNFVVNGTPRKLRPVARLSDPRSGRVMTIDADQPGVQLYSGNFLDGSIAGKNGVVYNKHAALCLETQRFPNAVNVPAWRHQVVLKPGETYKHTMIHRFTAE